MNEQPTALRLADALETADAYSSSMDGTLRVKIAPSTLDEAAAELRRLHELAESEGRWASDYLKRAVTAEERITGLEAALRQALEALERGETELRYQAITAVQQALGSRHD